MSENQGKGRVILKAYFEADKMPREGHFGDLIDSGLNKTDDQLFISVEGEGENSARFLGIGSTDPQSPLSIRNRTGDAKLIGFEDTGGSEEWHVSINPDGIANGLLLAHNNNPNTALMVEADGNVGIGTQSPEERLHVEGSTKINGNLEVTDTVKANKIEGSVSWNYLTDIPNSLIPTGVILMWSGSTGNIPSGWIICDGANGTPDLRDRFIVGAGGGYIPGNTGGQNYVTLTEGQMPSHNHPISDPGHRHYYTDQYRYDNVHKKSGPYQELPRSTKIEGKYTNYSSTGISILNSGNNEGHENRPPYYALCYIMKL